MTLPRLGHAVIVNNIASELPGSKVDVEALKDAYETVGFDVQVHEDCSAQVSKLLTAREGKVFRCVCRSFCSQVGIMSLPVWSHVPSGGI